MLVIVLDINLILKILLLTDEALPPHIVYNLQIQYMGYPLETAPSGVYYILEPQYWRVHQ